MEEINRPTFLSVLCILTFIGSAWGIINAISSYKNAEVAVGITHELLDEALDEFEDNAELGSQAEFFSNVVEGINDGLTVDNVQQLGILGGIASVLTLIGAILMWGLNKKGYWIYLGGIALGVFAPIMIYEGILGMLVGGGAAFIGVIFVVLYGINLKHLE